MPTSTLSDSTATEADNNNPINVAEMDSVTLRKPPAEDGIPIGMDAEWIIGCILGMPPMTQEKRGILLAVPMDCYRQALRDIVQVGAFVGPDDGVTYKVVAVEAESDSNTDVLDAKAAIEDAIHATDDGDWREELDLDLSPDVIAAVMPLVDVELRAKAERLDESL